MKIIIRILGLLFVLFLLKDCLGLFYTKMTHLSKSDLEWIKTGDALFESSMGKRAKLTNMGCYVYNESNPFYISSAGDWYYEANAGYSYEISQNGLEFKGYFAIRRSIANDSLEYDTRLNRLSTIDYQPIKSKPIEINNLNFNECIVVDLSNGRYLEKFTPEVDIKITKFIISKRYGLIYYELENGEKYYRKFKNRQDNIEA